MIKTNDLSTLVCHNPLRQQSKASHVKIEISVQQLAELIKKHYLSVADFRCLDCDSKSCVRDLCLDACLKTK